MLAPERSHEQPVVTREATHLNHGVVAVDSHHPVDNLLVALIDRRDEAVADALDLVKPGIATLNGAGLARFERDDQRLLIDLANCLSDADERPSGAHSHHECVGSCSFR